MSHPIEITLFQGLRAVEVPRKYNRNGTISLSSIFDDGWEFMRVIVSKGSVFLQNEGWKFGCSYPYYVISKNQSDGSLQIFQQGREVPLYKSQPFSNWQWFTYRILCLYLTRLEVATLTMFLVFITTLTCYVWVFYFLNSILGNSIGFVLIFWIFNLICIKIVFELAKYSESN